MSEKKKVNVVISLDSYIELKVLATRKQKQFSAYLGEILEKAANRMKSNEAKE